MVITKEQIQFGNGNDRQNKYNLATAITDKQIQFNNSNNWATYNLVIAIIDEQI